MSNGTPLTEVQFQALAEQGFSNEEIIEFEGRSSQTQGEPGIGKRIEEGIPKVMEFLNKSLVPPSLTDIGSKIRSVTPEALQPGLDMAANTAKGSVFPLFGGHLSREVVDKPFQSLITAATANPIGLAGKAAGVTGAINASKPIIGGLVGSVAGDKIGGATADYIFGEGEYTKTGSLIGSIIFGAGGALAGKGLQMSPQKLAYYKQVKQYKGDVKAFNLKNQRYKGDVSARQVADDLFNTEGGIDAARRTISNNSDDFVKGINNIDEPLGQSYKGVESKYLNKRTSVNSGVIEEMIPDSLKDEVIPLIRKNAKVAKATKLQITDAKGTPFQRNLSFEELTNMGKDIQKHINSLKIKNLDSSGLQKVKKFIKQTTRDMMNDSDKAYLADVDVQYTSVIKKKIHLLKKMGYDPKSQQIDTAKLDAVLSSKGDVNLKDALNVMADLDDAIKANIDIHKDYMNRININQSPRPIAPTDSSVRPTFTPPVKPRTSIPRELIKWGSVYGLGSQAIDKLTGG